MAMELADRYNDGALQGAGRTSDASTWLRCPTDRRCHRRGGPEPDAGGRTPKIHPLSARHRMTDRDRGHLEPHPASAPTPFDEEAAADQEAGSGLAFGLLAAFSIERIVDFLRCAGLLPRDRTSPVASTGRRKQRDRAIWAILHLAGRVRPGRIRVNPTHSRDCANAVELLRGLRLQGQLGTSRNIPIRGVAA
jgi:hypothetical protein